CRLAWFVMGSVGVKQRETRCEGRGPASGHKRGHKPTPLPSPVGGSVRPVPGQDLPLPARLETRCLLATRPPSPQIAGPCAGWMPFFPLSRPSGTRSRTDRATEKRRSPSRPSQLAASPRLLTNAFGPTILAVALGAHPPLIAPATNGSG